MTHMECDMKYSGLFLVFLFLACENSTQPDNQQKPQPAQNTITETDSEGHFTGHFDREDWVPDNVFFDNSVKIEPNHCVHYVADEKNRWDTHEIRFENMTSSAVQLSFNRLEAPFSTAPETLELAPLAADTISISFYLAEDPKDEIMDSLVIKNGSQSEKIYFWGLKSRPYMTIPVCPVNRFTFGPAFPNPMKDNMGLSFTLPEQTWLSVVVLDGSRQVKMLASGEHDAGYFRFRWDCTDDSGQKLPPGIYTILFESEKFNASGDIKIVE